MFTRLHAPLAALGLCAALAACGPATQNIPISSDPGGAQVLVDGQEYCTTPCTATLEKTQDHILTIRKEGYRQVDVPVTRKYDTAGVARQATQAGMRSSGTGANTEGAVANALLAVGAAEDQGTAYVLTPSTVVVRMMPAHQTAQAGADGEPITITTDQLAPQDRDAVLRTTEPATMGDAVAEDPAAAAKAVLEAGAVAAPSVGTKKEWKSSHSSESHGDGSYTRKTSSTKVGVGVSVNPVEAGLGLLNLIEGSKENGESAPAGDGQEN
jgi:hypothetical protein